MADLIGFRPTTKIVGNNRKNAERSSTANNRPLV
jgi:hypothetical protein